MQLQRMDMFQVVEEKQSLVQGKFEVIKLWSKLKIDPGISCYKCLNLRGITPDKPFPGMLYGPGCEAGNLDKDFLAPCVADPSEPSLDSCYDMEMVLNNAENAGTLKSWAGSGASLVQLVRGTLWNGLKLFEGYLFNNPVLPERPPAEIPMNLCSCKRDDCNGNCKCGGIGDPDPSTSPSPGGNFAGKGVTTSVLLIPSSIIISLTIKLYL
ncbi:hypothetical protein Fcan01_18989 [Folsomia candida]|uniref:Uncharacterized protein n=1 Tax=Folsomia candida TaxID=158441 RepID=A0A226DNB4_FOLCA|nr:hypothetical protein Fcan01_18989 [Folsomia candida]